MGLFSALKRVFHFHRHPRYGWNGGTFYVSQEDFDKLRARLKEPSNPDWKIIAKMDELKKNKWIVK